MTTDQEKNVIEAARALRMAKRGDARARTLQQLFDAVDQADGVKAVEVR